MQPKTMKKSIIITAVLIVTGAAVAFAGSGWGYRGQMMAYGPGDGYRMGRGQGYGPGNCPYYSGSGANLTDEQIAKIDAARDKFFADTETLRKQIRDKRIALGDAMRAKTPDEAEVLKLQKDLSNLEGEFDQIAVQHRLEMDKLLPDNVGPRGYGPGNGRGFGRGGDRGSYGGPCWR